MALAVLQLNGNLDGEFAIDTAATDHVAGQPAKHTATGVALALTPATTMGLFKNDMADEVLVGPSVGDALQTGLANATVLKGINTVKMTGGKLKTGAAQTPFLFPPTNSPWTKGNHLFVSTAGFWDNAPGTANDPPMGICNKPPASATDSLEADMFSLAPFQSTVAT